MSTSKMKYILCIKKYDFNLISIGTIYEIDDEDRYFYYIYNNSGNRSGYFKNKFFLIPLTKLTKLLFS